MMAMMMSIVMFQGRVIEKESEGDDDDGQIVVG
jgi:hypothetical protein